MKFHLLLCCCAKAQKFCVFNATSPLLMNEVCVNKVEACASVEQTLGMIQGVGVDTNREKGL